MFHHLPGDRLDDVRRFVETYACRCGVMEATLDHVRHLGTGVAFAVESEMLRALRGKLAERFKPWLGRQDLQKWQPHITVQNKVAVVDADALHERLALAFRPTTILIAGIDIWRYLGGPWELIVAVGFKAGENNRDIGTGLALDP
jgi:hypothetical protein